MEKLENIISTYQQIIQESEQALQRARKRIYYISLLRLVLFVEAIAAAFIFWSDGWLSLFVFAILPFISFIWLVKRHNLWFYRKDYLKKKIEINEHRSDFPLGGSARHGRGAAQPHVLRPSYPARGAREHGNGLSASVGHI